MDEPIDRGGATFTVSPLVAGPQHVRALLTLIEPDLDENGFDLTTTPEAVAAREWLSSLE